MELGWRWLVVVLVAGACGPGRPSSEGGMGGGTGTTGEGEMDAADPGSSTDAETAGLDSTGMVPETVCEAGENECTAQGFLRVCGQDGQWALEMPCPRGSACVPCDDGDDCTQAACVYACPAVEEHAGSGCEFIVQATLNPTDDTDGVTVTNPSADLPTNVQLLRIGLGTADETVVEEASLAPAESITWSLGVGTGPETSSLVTGGMLRVRSDRAVVAYQQGPELLTTGNDSSLLLPDSVLGRTYVIPSYTPRSDGPSAPAAPSFFDVVPISDDTTVTWVPTVATEGAGSFGVVQPGDSGEIVLNRHDALRVAAVEGRSGVHDELSGTVVTASAPIRVAGGTRCATVPVPDAGLLGFCDPLQEVLIPVEHWGSETVVPPPPPRDTENHYWRIYAGADGTTFTTEPQVLSDENCAPPATFDDGACTLPQLGSWIEIEVANGTAFVVHGASERDRTMVVGYLQSRESSGNPPEMTTEAGDPAMVQLVAVQAFGTSTIATSWSGFQQQYVQVVRPAGGATVFVGGVGVGGWSSVGDYEFANVPLTGTATVQSGDPIGITQYGYNASDELNPDCISEGSPGQCASSYAHGLGWNFGSAE